MAREQSRAIFFSPMRIAVDVMGGDHGCGVIIAGVKRALEEIKDISTIYLVGNKADIHAALPERGFRDHRFPIRRSPDTWRRAIECGIECTW